MHIPRFGEAPIKREGCAVMQFTPTADQIDAMLKSGEMLRAPDADGWCEMADNWAGPNWKAPYKAGRYTRKVYRTSTRPNGDSPAIKSALARSMRRF